MLYNMDFIKKHWMKIVIGLFVVVFLGMCTNNCSNKNTIRTMQQTYSKSDSIILSLNDSVCLLNDSIKYLNKDIKALERDNFSLQNHVNDLNKALKRNVVVNITSDKNEE